MPLDEKIEILALLCADPVDEIRIKAFDTLAAWNVKELQQVFSSPTLPSTLLDFGMTYLAPGRKEIQDALLKNPQLPEDLRAWVKSLRIRPGGETAAAPPPPTAPGTPAQPVGHKDEKRETLLQKISHLAAPEKIKLALVGSQEERLILIRDPNRMVSRAVLESPKLSDQEIENIASMKNVTEEVLRLVATNRRFMKSYQVVRALVNNPRAPIDVTVPMINRLNERDQKALTLNRNVPDVLRAMALKAVKQKEEAKKVKISTGHH